MKKIKLSAKTALVSGLVAASTAGIVYATPEILESINSDTTDNLKLVVEKVDNDTARVSIDNIKEIPRSLQFSIKLDGAELKDGENSIHDLVSKEIETIVNTNEDQSNSNKILTDYTYDKDKNTIDVLITADNSIPKNANKVDVFDIDLKFKSKGIFNLDLGEMVEGILSKNKVANKYTITPNDDVEYKYVSDANKEYVSKKVDYSKEEISMNSNPTISSDGRSIQLMEGEKIQLTAENLGITMKDDEDDDKALSLEVKYEGNVITEFSQTTPGVYNLEAIAKDSYGETSEELIIQVGVIEEKITTEPIITKGDKELEDVTLNAGDIFNPMEDIKARDGKGNDLKVNLSVDKELDLDPETTTEYKLTYTAIDKYENKAEKTITLTVNANKAPVILGVKDHNLMVGDSFDPREGVTVIDKDENIELQVDSNVSVNIPGEYKVSYTATDSKGKTSRAQSKVVVISNETGINNPPEIYATDKTIKLGTAFNPLDGVTASDKEDGPITNIKVIENTVKVNEEGQYKVTYSVEDSTGAITTKTITVTVKGELNLVESITINNKFSKMYLENEKTVTVSINGDADVKDVNWSTSNSNVAEIEVIGNSAKIIARSEGKATITVSTKDGSNKSDSFTINVVDFKNDSEMPSYIKDIVDTNILLPIVGSTDGSKNSPVEFEMRNITVDKLDEFLKSISNLNPVIKDIYSKGDFTVYKLKLTQEVGLLDKLRNIRAIGLFNSNSNVDIYVEIKVNNYLSNASQLKARLNELKSDNNSGNTGGSNGSSSGNSGSSSGGNGNTGGNSGSSSGDNGSSSGNGGNSSADNGSTGGNGGSSSSGNGSIAGNDESSNSGNISTGGNNESLSGENGSGTSNGSASFNNNTGAVENTKITENSKESDDEEIADNSESENSEVADDSETSQDKETSEKLEVSENSEKVDEKNTIITVLGYGAVIVAAIISGIFFLKNKNKK
ncbi:MULTISPECIES: immunoglobulin-like domain-containing protein [Clostridium]|uniref:immunoglobulin-like domain-containing protein n=1 Tax=Clostridium TaxID=1485 RepID=UPI0012E57F39|nr:MULTISPECIES: immunoglobulin-like domain-containing protein [Clostridium]SUQ52508.1 Pesticidal crystal protein Cry22Aa [Clostridium neonatale]